MTLNPNQRGILAMTLAMGCFVTNDALVKLVSASLPAAELIFVRGLLSTLMLGTVALALGQFKRSPDAPHTSALSHMLARPVWVRAVLDATTTVAYLTSLFHLPIGNATAISMVTPLLITLYAVLMWGERVGLARWLAIVMGFVGVLLIVQPQADGFNAWALVCLLSTALQAARDLVTRSISPSVPSLLISLATAAVITFLSGLFCLFTPWVALVPLHWLLLVMASALLSAAYYLIIVGMRNGDMSLIAPFRYAGLLFALLFGWLVWHELPNALAWGGIGLLLGAGLWVLRSENQR